MSPSAFILQRPWHERELLHMKLLLQDDIVAARVLFWHCRFDIEPKVLLWAPVLVVMWRFWLVDTNRRLPSVQHSCHPHMRDRGEEIRGWNKRKSMYVDLFCSQVSEGNCCVTEASVTQSFVLFLYLHVTGYACKYKHTSSHKHQSAD